MHRGTGRRWSARPSPGIGRGRGIPFAATPLSRPCVVSSGTTTVTTTLTTPITTISASTAGTSNIMDGEDASRDLRDLVRNIDGRLKSLEAKTVKLASVIKELSDIIKKYCKTSFTIKGTPLEVSTSLYEKNSIDIILTGTPEE